MNDWHRMSITELLSSYNRDSMTPSEVVEHMLDRIGRYNPELRAFIEVDAEGARATARISDLKYAADEQRPLEGVPIAIKANIAVKGMEQNAGMQARAGMIAQSDANCVARLRSAGAIILGTLNMHEAALGATNDNTFFGRCLNPHGENLTPGGSSGGSAAAVAAGLCTAALGTDTLGSIRVPASYCGIFALKPTAGIMDDSGLVPLSPRFDSIGPMARSMDDLSLMTNILFTPDLATAMRRSRFMALSNLGGVECDAEVLEIFQAVLSELPEQQDHIILPRDASRIRKAAFMVTVRDLIPSLVELGEARCNSLSPELQTLIEIGIERSQEDLAEDMAILGEAIQTLRSEIGSNGVLIVPTAPQVAFEHGKLAPANQADFTALANIAGLCAISVPIGRTRAGMPVGLQLIGPPGAEAMLIAQARMINDRVRGYAMPAAFE
jgi:aspartyl-tRNA(Asn)/glutamyl-tRNA(Gln) amidotransferase subunit A